MHIKTKLIQSATYWTVAIMVTFNERWETDRTRAYLSEMLLCIVKELQTKEKKLSRLIRFYPDQDEDLIRLEQMVEDKELEWMGGASETSGTWRFFSFSFRIKDDSPLAFVFPSTRLFLYR